MKLFPKEKIVGVFRGFSKGGMEFHAEIILPYRNELQSVPMHGHFLLVQLEHENEAVLGRITALSSEGRLASSPGEDYSIRAIADDRVIPEDLLKQYLKYRVDIRVLGVVRVEDGRIVFAPSHRRLPHVGSKVAFPSEEILREVAGHNLDGVELGFYALGEFIYSGADERLVHEPWIKVRSPAIIPRFQIKNLVSRRSFIFARAGFGKSNLNKLLFSSLYKETPTIEKRGGKRVPVGTIIFDPDGEYYWPDDKSRPGLCDVPELEDKLVVFTKKKGPSAFYNSFVASDIKLDIRRLKAAEVLSIALSPERQEQQNVRKLKGMSDQNWRELVDLIHDQGNLADEDKIKELLHLKNDQSAETVAARSNMTAVIKMLHDPASWMLDMLIFSLRAGKLCVIDISQLRGEAGLILSGIILQKIFEFNQEQFTSATPETIPTIAVVEEAQSVLGNSGSLRPYVEWVKEGRKYDLGAVLITQQPGSISNEILSQGDNWFAFHLLSAGDLQALKKANAHFSDDILSTLLNEPIVGNGIFWSSAGGKSYPIPLRVMSFEELYTVRDKDYDLPAAKTFAQELSSKFGKTLLNKKIIPAPTAEPNGKILPTDSENGVEQAEPIDLMETYINSAIEAFKFDELLIAKIKINGLPWFAIQERISQLLPDIIDEQERTYKIAYNITPRALNAVFGEGKWNTENRPKSKGEGYTRWVVLKNNKHSN